MQRLHIPNRIGVFLDAAIAAEEAHAADAGDALGDPFVLVLVCLVHQRVGFDVAVEVVRDEIVISLVNDGVAQGRETTGVPEFAAFDGVKDFGKIGVEAERAIIMSVAKILHVFRKIAEKENIRVADFASDFDLIIVNKNH